MSLWDDERAQPIQIGFILVFAVLIVSFAVYQSVFVPQQNAEIEFQHYQQVGQDVTDLRNDLRTAVGSESTRSASVTLGTTYPARVFALNPAPPGGTLATSDAGTVEVNGLGPTSSADLCATGASTVESRSLVYRPSYNEYGPAKNVTYENTFAVRSFEDGARYGSQALVQESSGSGDNRINLRLLTSEFSESGTGTTSVDLEPSRTYTESFSPGNQFSVVVPSQFAPDTWETEILDDATGIVNGVQSAGPDRVRIVLAPGDYTISCAAIGLNEQPAYQPPADGTDDADRAYNASWDVAAIEGERGVQGCSDGVCTYDRADDNDENLELTASTDPVAVDATLEFALNDTSVGPLSAASATTDTSGEATTTLDTSSTGSATVYVSGGGSGDALEIEVIDSGGPGGGGGGNPNT